jgi:hypothetical protein
MPHFRLRLKQRTFIDIADVDVYVYDLKKQENTEYEV